ncbi:MAG TPA: cation diffusion facilitator family transporter [Acidimicrobiales bacterium]|nr:cation diffusion facilitator family transporter [Acidimicrobiales bacterium]
MSRTARLWVVLVANLALVVGLVVVGADAHSVGVWAEGADYLADAAGIGVALGAIRLGRHASDRRPGGFPRATRIAAAVNAGWLLLLCTLVAAGAIDRLARGAGTVHGLPVLVASGIAAAVMLGGALLLGGDDDDEDDDDDGEAMTVRAIVLDTAADAAAAAGVAVAGGVILATGRLSWLDPAVALVIAVVVGWHAQRLLRRVVASLRAGAPQP